MKFTARRDPKWENLLDPVIYNDIMGLFMGIYSDTMGFFMGIYSDLMGLNP